MTHGDILPSTGTDEAQVVVVQSVHGCLDAILWKKFASATRWLDKLELQELDNELNGALSSAKQFICSVTGLPLPPLASSGLGDYQVESLLGEQYACPSLVLRHLQAGLYSLELPPSSSLRSYVLIRNVTKMVTTPNCIAQAIGALTPD